MGGNQRNGGPENQFDCSPSGVHGLVSVSAELSFPETNRHWSGLLFVQSELVYLLQKQEIRLLVFLIICKAAKESVQKREVVTIPSSSKRSILSM